MSLSRPKCCTAPVFFFVTRSRRIGRALGARITNPAVCYEHSRRTPHPRQTAPHSWVPINAANLLLAPSRSIASRPADLVGLGFYRREDTVDETVKDGPYARLYVGQGGIAKLLSPGAAPGRQQDHGSENARRAKSATVRPEQLVQFRTSPREPQRP